MHNNPYSSPNPADATRPHAPTVQWRVFAARSVSFKLTQQSYRDEIRREAQLAIEQEIGAENVIAIVEHPGTLEGFSVVVWYRVQTQGPPA